MPAPVIALMTDFGQTDPFVGIMKGIVLSRLPEARIVDLTHNIPPQDVRLGAFYLMASVPYFPADTIFVCVVDPGVGSERRIVWARNRTHQFLAPDNGLLSWIESKNPFTDIRQVTNEALFTKQVSHTFHGRDIFAPVAAELAAGLLPRALGAEVSSVKGLPFPMLKRGQGKVQASVLAVDRFGNVITNAGREELKPAATVRFKEQDLGPLKSHYSEAEPGQALALVGSFGFMELAVRNDSFAKKFEVKIGDPVDILFPA